LLRHGLDDVASLHVLKITADVSGAPSLVNIVAILVLKHYDVALVITVKVSENIVDVEVTSVGIRRDLDGWFSLLEVLE